MQARIHNIVSHTNVLGPGTRAAIWFQGCNKNCMGCMSQTTRDISGGKIYDVDKICSDIVSLTDIEGITLSGGEVFLQIDALYDLLKRIRSTSDLGVIIYTGFYLQELREMNNPKVNEIIDGLADIIIDGPYIDDLNDGVSLKGSSNQNVHFITDRYIMHKDMYEKKQRNAEVYVNGNELFFVGIPEKKTLDSWKKISGNINKR